MVCDLCKDGEAVIQLTEIEGSGVRQLHLCEKCAAERGVETVEHMVRLFAGHDVNHTRQVEQILGSNGP